jgi:hypothetical protein
MSLIKKIFIISSSLLLIVLFFGGIYFFAFKKDTPSSSQSQDTSADIKKRNLPITLISEEAVIAPTITDNGSSVIYYSKNDGRVYQVDLDGKNKKTISNKMLPGLEDVFWSPDKTKVITKTKFSSGYYQFGFFDYNTHSGRLLSPNIDTVTWQSNSKIVYKYFDSVAKQGSLNISDPDGKNWTKLSPLNTKYVTLAPIPKSGLVSVWNSPEATTETILGSVSILDGEMRVLFGGKNYGVDYLWSNDGNHILMSSSNEKGGKKISLSVMDSQAKDQKNLDIPTFASKCIWSKDNKTIYYALPGSIPDNVLFPNDYLSEKIKTIDTFWRVDITNGEKTRLVDLNEISGQFDATDLFLNANESYLFFVNRFDGKLYRISI